MDIKPSYAVVCLIYKEGNAYTQRVFEWAQKLMRDSPERFVEISSAVFVASSKTALEIVLQVAMEQKPLEGTPPLRVVVFPCASQVFGVMTAELKTRLGDLGLEASGVDHPSGKKTNQG